MIDVPIGFVIVPKEVKGKELKKKANWKARCAICLLKDNCGEFACDKVDRADKKDVIFVKEKLILA
jgi:hypothetical protein